MSNKGYSLRAAAKLAGVPTMTFYAWKKKGLVTSDLTDDKGNFLFSEIMIERAKEIDAKRKAKKSVDSSGNLFEETDPVAVVDTGEEIISEPFVDDGAINADALPQNSAGSSIVDDDSPNDSEGANNDEEPAPAVLENSTKQTPPAENDYEAVAAMDAATPEKINSDASKNLGDLSDGEVNHLEKEKAVDVIETAITIDLAPASEIITLEERANRIRKLQADVQRGIIEIGFELIAAKKEIGHGGWADWLATNFDWTQQTANRFMRVSERFGKLNNVVQFKPSTLQAMLALPEGDEDKFIAAQADKGRPIEDLSTRDVQKAVKEWNQQQEAGEIETFSSSEKTTPSDASPVVEDNHSKIAALVALDYEEENLPDEEPKKLPPIAHNRNSTTDWHTPIEYIEAAREVLGTIDLDPASSELANQTVKAKQFFTADDDGLNHEWRGRIWLNPPFNKDKSKGATIDQFVDKLIASSFEAAIILVDNATETRWFRKLADNSSAIVFTTGRINFFKGGTQEAGSPTRGQTFFYFGSAVNRFYATFQQFGWCAQKIVPPIIEAAGGDSDDAR